MEARLEKLETKLAQLTLLKYRAEVAELNLMIRAEREMRESAELYKAERLSDEELLDEVRRRGLKLDT